MKKTVLFIFLAAFAATFYSCKTDFSVNGSYQEIPVIHGILDQNDTLHFIKINRTFLGDGNAFDFAQIPDSSYFQTVNATITEYDGGNITRTWTLTDTLIQNKEPGIFYAPEQKLYYFKTSVNQPLLEDKRYVLNANIDNGEHNVTASTELVQGMMISNPSTTSAFSFADNNVAANGYKSSNIIFSKGTGRLFDVQMKFYYTEFEANDTVAKQFTWKIATINGEDINSASKAVSIQGETFYQLIANNVPVDADVLKRRFDSLGVIVTGASEDLEKYILVNQPTSSLAQSKPEFTNVEGGLGIFSSRSTIVRNRKAWETFNPLRRAMNTASVKELCNGQYTFDRLFCSDNPNDNATSFACSF